MKRIAWLRILGGLWGLACFAAVTGCSVNLSEAFSAGIYDFVAGTVTETLSALNPVTL